MDESTKLMEGHEKMAWMLRALLERKSVQLERIETIVDRKLLSKGRALSAQKKSINGVNY